MNEKNEMSEIDTQEKFDQKPLSSKGEELRVTPGEKLKQERLKRNITLEDITERTKIAASTLKKFEDNKFDIFKSDMYVKGFIKNICEILEIDSKEMIDLYKKYKGDQEIDPSEHDKDFSEDELSGEERSVTLKKMIIMRTVPAVIIISVVLLVTVSLVKIFDSSSQKNKTVRTVDNRQRSVKPINMFNETETFELSPDAVINILFQETKYVFKLVDIAEGVVSYSIQEENGYFQEGESFQHDFNDDGQDDVKVALVKISGDLVIVKIEVFVDETRETDYQAIWDNEEHTEVPQKEQVILFDSKSKYPIMIYIKALEKPSYLQYNIDGKRQNTMNLKTGTSTILTADEHVEIIIGNYRGVAFVVNKLPLDIIGKNDNFSTTKIVKWIPSPENETRWQMIISDVN